MSQAGIINVGAGPINPFGPLMITFVNFAMSPYTVTSTDQYIAVDPTGGAITITLPATTISGRLIIIKDRTGVATKNNITVSAGASTIDLAASYVMAGNFDAIALIYDGMNNWEIW